MFDITFDITKIKPFNCKYYAGKTRLSIPTCIGFCILNGEENMTYCKGANCDYYKEE